MIERRKSFMSERISAMSTWASSVNVRAPGRKRPSVRRGELQLLQRSLQVIDVGGVQPSQEPMGLRHTPIERVDEVGTGAL
jgi:hypothetical protein